MDFLPERDVVSSYASYLLKWANENEQQIWVKLLLFEDSSFT